jgi:hypothetical protein
MVVGAWNWLVFSLEGITSDGNAQGWLAFGGSAAAGLLIGRLWALGVPVLTAIGVGVYAAGFSSCTGECRDDMGVSGAVAVLIMYSAFADLGIGIGIGANRLLRRALARRGYLIWS